MALNGELRSLGGRLLEAAHTAPAYRLYALPTTPPKPGMLRVEPGKGAAIELEIWALPPAAFGEFVAAIPPPLSIASTPPPAARPDPRGRGPQRERLYRRRRRHRGRARHLRLRRLAGLYGGDREGGGVT